MSIQDVEERARALWCAGRDDAALDLLSGKGREWARIEINKNRLAINIIEHKSYTPDVNAIRPPLSQDDIAAIHARYAYCASLAMQYKVELSVLYEYIEFLEWKAYYKPAIFVLSWLQDYYKLNNASDDIQSTAKRLMERLLAKQEQSAVEA